MLCAEDTAECCSTSWYVVYFGHDVPRDSWLGKRWQEVSSPSSFSHAEPGLVVASARAKYVQLIWLVVFSCFFVFFWASNDKLPDVLKCRT